MATAYRPVHKRPSLIDAIAEGFFTVAADEPTGCLALHVTTGGFIRLDPDRAIGVQRPLYESQGPTRRR